MKGSLTVVAFFCAGCLMGVANDFQFDLHDLSMYVLYALMFQVGIGIGSNKKLKELVKSLRPKMLLVPMATIVGTLLFSAFASLLLSQWSVFDCMAVGSGFAYYSLSSILITQFKEPSIGLQLATELGTIALLANIFREMMALLGAPLIRKYFGKLAPISAAGVNSMDVLLPSITQYSGKDVIPIAIFHGILIDMSVPVFVSFFCNLYTAGRKEGDKASLYSYCNNVNNSDFSLQSECMHFAVPLHTVCSVTAYLFAVILQLLCSATATGLQ